MKSIKSNRALKKADANYNAGDLDSAIEWYQAAIDLNPKNWEAHFGKGVCCKWLARWEECLESSIRASQLYPRFVGSWWNIGIAATALGRWKLAREGWIKNGVELEISDKPLTMNLGRVPIRLKTTNSEVVWCDRLDPARTKIVNVPTAASQHRCGDILINDGEPVGSRFDGEREVHVFNELQILQASKLGTFTVEIENITEAEALALEEMRSDQIHIEDWSTMEILCSKCSAGVPHQHHDDKNRSDPTHQTTRQFAFATLDEQTVRETLQKWQGDKQNSISEIDCLIAPTR